MKKIALLLMLSVVSLTTMADEGMWFLMHLKRLNEADMQKMGLQLTAEEIYSINNSILKDAIVQFNGGSNDGLFWCSGIVLTTHPGRYDLIAELSTPAKDYMTNSFWAKNHSEELTPRTGSVRCIVRMDDVTVRILSLVNDSMSE